MIIVWHGHACFTLASEQGPLAIDPFVDHYVPGLSPLKLTAEQVLCSHSHGDHGAAQLVPLSGRPTPFEVETLDTFHDPEQGTLRGKNTVHILSAEGLRVAHLGDLGCMPTPEQVETLKGLDAVLIPVGGFYTIDAAQAKALVDDINPRVVVPMHYRSDSFGFDVLGTVEDYAALCDEMLARMEG